MTTVTAYKILNIKGVEYLQYLKSYKWFFFFSRYDWCFVPYPNDKGKHQIVCSKIPEYHILRKFIIKYPDVEIYFNSEYVERKNKFKKGNH